MIKEARGTGATIDEARENAVLNLNASELDDIQFEIISMPKKKILGIFGGNDAEVRAYIELPDKKAKQPKKAAAKPQTEKNEKMKNEVSQKAQKVKKIEKVNQKAEKKSNEEYSAAVDESQVPSNSPAGKAIAYIRTVLANLNCGQITIKVAFRENGALITLDGDDLSIIIGRRGETLDAMQYLVSLAANNGGGHFKISINIGNYREKREETLKALANKISAQVLKTGKSRYLEPMNPYERRIIHTAVQEIEGVVSTSFGEGTGRRVVISCEGTEVKPPRFNNDRRRGSGYNRSRKLDRQQPVAPSREPKKDSDMPLYGKIN